MIVTKRTKLSLSQFLDLFGQDVVTVLLDKYDISTWGFNQTEIAETLVEVDSDSFGALVDELVRTSGDLRNRVSPRYRFDERWSDFEKCLLLDGFRLEEKEIIRVEPVIDAVEPLEDDLAKELEESGLALIEETRRHINLSAESFRKSTPDYNSCLSHARIALETIVRSLAKRTGLETDQNSKAWGKALSHIRSKGMITDKEESAVASTYTFISDGSHVPVGFTKEEFARFGRNLAMSVCYFIIKQANAE
jgi:hypothetical protein